MIPTRNIYDEALRLFGSAGFDEALAFQPRTKVIRKVLPRPSLEARFWNSVSQETDTDCWLWQGDKSTRGYGRIMGNGKRWWAAHLSLELHGRPQPSPDMLACHHCDVRLCVNPDHLYWGSNSDNQKDHTVRGSAKLSGVVAAARRRAAQTHCKHGHEFTQENTIAFVWHGQAGRHCRACGAMNSAAYRRRKSLMC